MTDPASQPSVRIVHEGRGGYVEVDGRRYAIEHVDGGRFCIHFTGSRRSAEYAHDLAALERLVLNEPAKWTIERR